MKKLHKKCPYILIKLLIESEVIIGKSQTEALMYVKAKVCTVDVISRVRERKRKTNRKKHVLISRPPIATCDGGQSPRFLFSYAR